MLNEPFSADARSRFGSCRVYRRRIHPNRREQTGPSEPTPPPPACQMRQMRTGSLSPACSGACTRDHEGAPVDSMARRGDEAQWFSLSTSRNRGYRSAYVVVARKRLRGVVSCASPLTRGLPAAHIEHGVRLSCARKSQLWRDSLRFCFLAGTQWPTI